MKGLKNKYLTTKLLLAIIALSGLAAFAANNQTFSRATGIARPDVKIQISGSVQRDDKTVSLEEVEAVKPGEILDWNIDSTNEGTGDAQNYRVVGQIAKGTTFVAGTAKGEGSPVVTYSIDDGKAFSAQPLIDEVQADGSIKKVPAPVAMYTQVKFEWATALVSQTKFNATYRVRVK